MHMFRNVLQLATQPAVRSFVRQSLRQSLRSVSTTPAPKQDKKTFEVVFVRESGEKIKASGKVGESLLDVVVNSNLDIDGFGACEGTLACSTCHLIFKPEDYESLGEKPTDEELDMLDLAYGLCDTVWVYKFSGNYLVDACDIHYYPHNVSFGLSSVLNVSAEWNGGKSPRRGK